MTTQQINTNTRTSWTAYGLVIVFCAPLLIAGLLYVWRDHLTFNLICTGDLYNPPIDSRTLSFYDPRYLGKWQLMDICPTDSSSNPIIQATAEAIYIALGKERSRVTQRHLSAIPLQPGSVMIIDPEGWLVVHYAPDADPKGILKDFRRLLRLSHVK